MEIVELCGPQDTTGWTMYILTLIRVQQAEVEADKKEIQCHLFWFSDDIAGIVIEGEAAQLDVHNGSGTDGKAG